MAISDINPAQYATQLADNFTFLAQKRVTGRQSDAKAQRDGLAQLQKAIQDFRSAANGMSLKKSAVARTVTFDREGIATASATAKAASGSYSLFVEKIATASQMAYSNIGGVAPGAGSFEVKLAGGKSFSIDLSRADGNGDGTVTPDELARAINSNPQNTSLVSAVLVSVGGKTQLMLTSQQTGADQRISIDTSKLNDSALAASLGAPTTLSAADDAVIWLGAQGSGLRMQQGSNNFTGITGVALTLTRAMKTGDTPMNVTVANDTANTNKNVQTVVDAYNTLKSTLDKMLDPGKPADKVPPGPFAGDSAIQGLRSKLGLLMRQAFNGQSLVSLGVSSDRNGQLNLNTTKLQKALTQDPSVLDATLFGADGKSGLLNAFTSYTDTWTNVTNGFIKQRQDGLTSVQKSIDREQERITEQHDQAYNRYLAQFTRLKSMQDNMAKTLDMLNNL
ncbi:flagellar filament capping protein FliD [Paludibacterium paludis]|uniref:Flagellar hook-associated protein 2 n=1 Tax=Paludibacterium paludis TaxID=1225769 RepID=A0A918NXD3_9NEIS|nr:flagellar filament capping protein FliD [Paludibacterium paludis]GGY04627.1 lateral flagellar hook-associated protein 2 [Paludibacterium paludis]